MKSIFCILVCSLFLFGCNKTKEKRVVSASIDHINAENCPVMKGGVFNPSQLLDSAHYVQLETNENCLLGYIEKMEIFDNNIYIFDNNKKLYLFDITGRFIRQVVNEGRGPEELERIADFTLDREHKRLIVLGLWELAYYNLQGDFLSKKQQRGVVNYLSETALVNNTFIKFQTVGHTEVYSIITYSDQFEKEQEFHPVPMNRCVSSHVGRNMMSEIQNTVSVVKLLSDTIFQFDGQTMLPRYIVELPVKLPTAEICAGFNPKNQKKTSYYDFTDYLKNNNYGEGFSSVFETAHCLFAQIPIPSRPPYWLVWNKTQKKGYYIFNDYVNDNVHPMRPYFNPITSTEDMFVCMIKDGVMDTYREPDYLIDSEMRALAEQWQEDNNPILAFYYPKKYWQ